jgi:uncharacterized protein YndB with AHSA1/START domain
MSHSKIVTNTITIDAPVAKVWDALVNPVQTKKYMFGCEPITDWKPGSLLLWRGVFDGKELDAVKGYVVKIEPNKYLEYTAIDPNSTIPDIPENYLTVTYDLKEQNGKTVFTVTQGDYAKVAEGERRYNDTVAEGGWESILVQIKKLVEA